MHSTLSMERLRPAAVRILTLFLAVIVTGCPVGAQESLILARADRYFSAAAKLPPAEHRRLSLGFGQPRRAKRRSDQGIERSRTSARDRTEVGPGTFGYGLCLHVAQRSGQSRPGVQKCRRSRPSTIA